jgi:ADP-heptose:LPS heptosyltransferase
VKNEEIRNILVVRQHDQLGDMLCAIPLLRSLRERFPTASTTLVASPVNYQIMLHNPFVDEVLNYDKLKFFPGLQNIWRFYRKIRSRTHDLAVVPVTVSISTTSNMIAFLSGAPVRIGPRVLQGRNNSTSFCFTTTMNLDWTSEPRRHQTLRNLDILQPLNITTRDLSCPLGFTTEERNTAKVSLGHLRSRRSLLVGFHPGAGKLANRWHAEKFASIANKLSREHNAGIVITVGPMDKECLQQIKQHLQCEYVVVEDQRLRQVAALIDQLDLFIANDTGIMHVAGGTSVHTLSLFGPTDPLQWAPVGTKNRFISAKDGKMDSITTEEVYNVVELIIQEMQRN